MEGLAAERDAEAAARSAVELLPEMEGLCFGSFTPTGAEVVLTVCEVTSFDATRDVQAHWLARLEEMEGVERAVPVMAFVTVEK